MDALEEECVPKIRHPGAPGHWAGYHEYSLLDLYSDF